MSKLTDRVNALIARHKGLRRASKSLGISPSYLSLLARGKRKNPNMDILRRLGIERTFLPIAKIRANR